MKTPIKKDINNTPLQAEILKRNRANIKKQKLFSQIRNNIKYLFGVIGFTLVIACFLYLPFFNISNIEINELNYIDKNQIEQLSNSKVLEKNFFLVDLKSLRTSLLKKSSFVGSVYTEKLFPSKVIITINERKPSLVIDTTKDCVLLDEKGFVISIIQKESETCESIKTQYSAIILSGKDVNLDFQENTSSSFYFLDRIENVKSVVEYYGYQIDSFVLEDQVLRVNLFDGKSVLLSFSQDLDTQLKRLIIITGEMSNENMKFKNIDLRYERPIVTQ